MTGSLLEHKSISDFALLRTSLVERKKFNDSEGRLSETSKDPEGRMTGKTDPGDVPTFEYMEDTELRDRSFNSKKANSILSNSRAKFTREQRKNAVLQSIKKSPTSSPKNSAVNNSAEKKTVSELKTESKFVVNTGTAKELVIFAVGENDVQKLQKAIGMFGKSEISELRFDHGMNILNLAIDLESVEIVQHLSDQYKDDPKIKKSLVDHRYSKKMQAIH